MDEEYGCEVIELDQLIPQAPPPKFKSDDVAYWLESVGYPTETCIFNSTVKWLPAIILQVEKFFLAFEDPTEADFHQ